MIKLKNRIVLYIIVGVAAALIIGVVIASGYANGENSPARLLSLGERYLTELNYEQAVVQFLKVIELEPMNERAYLGAAEAYIGLGQTDDAIEILERGLLALPDSAAIRAMLEGLRAGPEQEDAAAREAQPANPNSPANWTDLNGMPVFDAEYITSVMGLPLEGMTLYDIPGIDAEAIWEFENPPATLEEYMSPGFVKRGYSSFGYNGKDEIVAYTLHYGPHNSLSQNELFHGYEFNFQLPDSRTRSIQFRDEALQRLWGINSESSRTDAIAAVLNSFRIENPEVYKFMEDPFGYWEDKEPFQTTDSNDIYQLPICRATETSYAFITYTVLHDNPERQFLHIQFLLNGEGLRYVLNFGFSSDYDAIVFGTTMLSMYYD